MEAASGKPALFCAAAIAHDLRVSRSDHGKCRRRCRKRCAA